VIVYESSEVGSFEAGAREVHRSVQHRDTYPAVIRGFRLEKPKMSQDRSDIHAEAPSISAGRIVAYLHVVSIRGHRHDHVSFFVSNMSTHFLSSTPRDRGVTPWLSGCFELFPNARRSTAGSGP
jgi:hypothetical protein